MTNREMELAYVWFCHGYNHGYDNAEFGHRYGPRKAWATFNPLAVIVEKQKKGEKKYERNGGSER